MTWRREEIETIKRCIICVFLERKYVYHFYFLIITSLLFDSSYDIYLNFLIFKSKIFKTFYLDVILRLW